MPLPILHQRSASSNEDLVRLFLQTDRRWAEHLAEPQVLDVGTAYATAALPDCPEANHVRDVTLPAGVSPEEAYRLVEAHFAAAGGRCAAWMLGTAEDSRLAPLQQLLEGKDYRSEKLDVLALPRLPAGPLAERSDLQIIPARASFRHVRELFVEAEAELGRRQFGERVEAHLDDPHLDALLAIKDGRAVGHAGIFGVGELARIDLFYVSPAMRRQGAGRTLLSHLLEIARRALYRHIFAGVSPSAVGLLDLYSSVGMKKAGVVTWAVSPRPSE